MLNELEIEMLTKAREILVEEKEKFICIAVQIVSISMQQEFSDDKEKCRLFIDTQQGLWRKIEGSLNAGYTVALWLYRETGIRSVDKYLSWEEFETRFEPTLLPRDQYDDLVRMCRITWLDRILETNEIK